MKEASFYINDTEYRSKGGERVKKKIIFLQHREGKNIYHSREKEFSQSKQRIFVMRGKRSMISIEEEEKNLQGRIV